MLLQKSVALRVIVCVHLSHKAGECMKLFDHAVTQELVLLLTMHCNPFSALCVTS